LQSSLFSSLNIDALLRSENQFFVTNTTPGHGPVQNLIGKAIVERILSAARAGKKFKVVVV
jgi:phospholipase D1/2